MNPNRICYGRLIINDEPKNLGRADVAELIRRFSNEYTHKRYQGEKLRLVLEISDDPLQVGKSLMSRELQLEAEMSSLMVTDESEEIYPGITLARVQEVMESQLYQDYEFVCEPANRIGVSNDQIEHIKSHYVSAYPDCAPHFPLWRDS